MCKLQLWKAEEKPTKGKLTRSNPATAGALKQGKLEPGDGVAVNQFVVNTGGRLFNTRGRNSRAEPCLLTWNQESSSSGIKCLWWLKKHWLPRLVLREKLHCQESRSKVTTLTMACPQHKVSLTKSMSKINGSVFLEFGANAKME